MKRFFYISDDLDDLANVEQELEKAGIAKSQVHIFSADEAGLEHREMHSLQDFMKRDVVHAALRGAMLGVVGASLVLAFAYFSDVTANVGWIPFLFLAVIVLGFCTWEGGLFGIQEPNHELRRFEAAIRDGRHLLLVDLPPKQVGLLRSVQQRHSKLMPVGEGEARPGWISSTQEKFRAYFHKTP